MPMAVMTQACNFYCEGIVVTLWDELAMDFGDEVLHCRPFTEAERGKSLGIAIRKDCHLCTEICHPLRLHEVAQSLFITLCRDVAQKDPIRGLPVHLCQTSGRSHVLDLNRFRWEVELGHFFAFGFGTRVKHASTHTHTHTLSHTQQGKQLL